MIMIHYQEYREGESESGWWSQNRTYVERGEEKEDVQDLVNVIYTDLIKAFNQ